jgi:hypothetical protein
MEVLVFLAAGPEFDIPRRPDGGPVIHDRFSLALAGTLAAGKSEKLPLERDEHRRNREAAIRSPDASAQDAADSA